MTLTIGTRLGSHEITALLGKGGMGEVYRAFDTRLQRGIAIKFLAAEVVDLVARRRFQREAQIASSLNHPHILTVYDVGEKDGRQYLVMELVEGGTLKDWLQEKRTWQEVVELLVGVADGLAAAHQAGILHRDIKPANILVTRKGHAKLADFGLAKPFESVGLHDAQTLTENATRAGVVIGTIAYMSPEQASGKPLDGRSDIFSFGAVLYESLSGRRAFQGTNDLELLQNIVHGPAHPLGREAPEALHRVIARTLEKDPAHRYQSTSDLVADLRAVLRDPGPSRHRLEEARGKRLSVVVLPFRLTAAAQDDQFLCAALADAVVNRLGATGTLLVRPTASVMRYAQAPVAWDVVARETNVDLVVEATIQKIGARLRVLIAVHRASDSATLYSSKHDGTMDDLFSLQDEITGSIGTALAPQPVLNAKSVRLPTEHALAYELYMRAADRVSRLNKWDTQTAIEMLSSATKLDPSFADAWAHLAQACIQMGVVFESDPRWFVQAEAAVAKTMQLDNINADAFCAQGQLLWTPANGYQNRAALLALNSALKINPGCHLAQVWRGLILLHLGLYNEARQALEEALESNPSDMRTLVFLGQTALYRGNYEDAHEFNARALAADPAAVWPNIFFPTIPLYLGRTADAIEKVAVARQMLPNEPVLISVDGMIAAHEGNLAKAEQLADAAVATPHSLLHTHHLWHNAAAVYSMCGKPDKSIALLHRCADAGLPNYLLFSSDPHLRALHNRPEFLRFMSGLRKEHEEYCKEFGSDDTALYR